MPRADADPSERADGPSLIAVWGEDDGSNAYQLGTREVDWHSHLRGQVFCVESGFAHVRTPHGSSGCAATERRSSMPARSSA
ncbi:cupin domain-containing protein [Burkholderia seminalis]|uniref:hypothetical protein n=1 Tax=Burkholderia seminalis TaxID=488731 RepID=UPI001F27C4C5|nr:hypothetical protein [Burkholderia seminalis]